MNTENFSRNGKIRQFAAAAVAIFCCVAAGTVPARADMCDQHQPDIDRLTRMIPPRVLRGLEAGTAMNQVDMHSLKLFQRDKQDCETIMSPAASPDRPCDSDKARIDTLMSEVAQAGLIGKPIPQADMNEMATLINNERKCEARRGTQISVPH